MDQRVYLRLENGDIVALEGDEVSGSTFVVQNDDSDDISQVVQETALQSTSYVIDSSSLQNATNAVENVSGHDVYEGETRDLGNIETNVSENVVYIMQHEGSKTGDMHYTVVGESGSIDTTYAVQTVDQSRTDTSNDKLVQYTDITNVQRLSGIETLSQVAAQEYAGSNKTSGTRQSRTGGKQGDVCLQNNDENISLSFYCQHCAETFEDLAKFKVHLKSEHDIDDFGEVSDVENEISLLSGCEICFKPFLDVKDLEEHKKTHNSENVSAAVDQSNQVSELNQTVRKVNYKCRHCDSVFENRSQLLEHVASEHPDKVVQDQNKSSSFTKCPYCHKMYVLRGSNKTMMKHIYTAHPGKSVEVVSTVADKDEEFDEQVKCPLCSLGFYWQKSLVRHIKDQHPKYFEENGNDIFADLGISDMKTPKRRLRRSLKDDDEEPHLNCTKCPRKFLWEKSLRKHMVSQHGESYLQSRKGQLVFRCPHCDLVSRYACAVRKHMERKHAEKVKGMNVSKLYVPTMQAEAVPEIELKTIDKRPVEARLNYCRPVFSCPFCSYASNQSSNLIRHLTSVKHGNIFTQEELKAIKITSFKIKRKYLNENLDEENLDGTVKKRLPKLKMSSSLYDIVMKKFDELKQQKMTVEENLFEKIVSDDDLSDMDIDNIIDVAENESEESFTEDEDMLKQPCRKRRKRNTKRQLSNKQVERNDDSDVYEEEVEIINDETLSNMNDQVNGKVTGNEQNSELEVDSSPSDNEMKENTGKRTSNDLEDDNNIRSNTDTNKGQMKNVTRSIPVVTAVRKKEYPQSKNIKTTTQNPKNKSGENKVVKCGVCLKEFSSYTEFREHLPSHVNIKLTFGCIKCENEFSLVKDLKNHMKKEHNMNVSSVNIENVKNSYVQMNGKPITTYDCPYCEMLFSQSVSLQQHISMDHYDNIETASIKQESDVAFRHKSNETVILAFNCQFCECFFHNIDDIVKHMYIVHKYVDRSGVNNDSSVRKSGRKRRAPKWLEESSDNSGPVKKTKDNNDGNESTILSSRKDTSLSRPKSKKQIKQTDENEKVYKSTTGKEKCAQDKGKNEEDADKDKKGINKNISSNTDIAVANITISSPENAGIVSKKVAKKSEDQIVNTPKNRVSKETLNDSLDIQDNFKTQNKCPHCDFVARRSSALAFHINIKHSSLNLEESERKPVELLENSPRKKKMVDLTLISRKKPEIEIKGRKNNQSGVSNAGKGEIKVVQSDGNAQGFVESSKISHLKAKNIEIVNPRKMIKSKKDSKSLLDEIENERNIDNDDVDYDIEFGDSDDDYKPENDDYDDDDSNIEDYDDLDEGYSVSESFECPYCKTGLFVKFSLLQSHVKKVHPSKVSSFSIANVKSHVQIDGTIKSSNLVHTCKYCKKSFSSRSHVRDHVKTKHGKKVAEDREKLARKTKDDSTEYYKCIFCNSLSSCRDSVMSHISKEHVIERDINLEEIVRYTFKNGDIIQSLYLCPHCDYKSRWKQTIMKHIGISHSEINESSIEIMSGKYLVSSKHEVKYQCVYCNWQYDTKTAVLSHIKETHPDLRSVTEEQIPVVDIADEVNGDYQCPYCDLKSKYKKCVSRHIERVHGNKKASTDDVICLKSKKTDKATEEGLVYMCPYCDIDSKWRQFIVRHMELSHADIMTFSEEIPSEYRLKSLNNLDQNNDNHEKKLDQNVDYFKCPYCDSVRKSKNDVVEHTVKYHPKKPRIEHEQLEKVVWEDGEMTSKDTLYKCQACDSGSKWKKTVVLHMQIAHPEIKTFHIKLCKAEFSKKEESDESTYICQLCNELLTNSKAIDAHCQQIHPTEEKVVIESVSSNEGLVNVFKCLYCEHQAGWRMAILKHTELCHPEVVNFKATDVVCDIVRDTVLEGMGGFQCPFCDTVNHWKKSIIRHMKTVHPQEDQSTPINFSRLASKKFGGRSSRKSSKQIKCLHCKLTCRSIEKIRRHFLSKHPKLAKDYLNKDNTEFVYDSFTGHKLEFKCILCSAKYVWKKSLLVHMRNRHGDMYHVYQALDHVVDIVVASSDGIGVTKQLDSSIQYVPESKTKIIKRHSVSKGRRSCGKCHRVFNTQWALSVHNKLKHRKSPKYRFPCGICSLSFPTLLLRIQHKICYHKRHTRRPVLQCTVAGCNFRCKFHKILQNHYNYKHNLQIPILGNTTFSTYGAAGSIRCEICLKKFSCKNSLKQHVDQHKKQRPVRFQCGTCGEQFLNGSLRDAHIEKYHFDKLEMCDVCGNLYTRANLKKHLKTHDEDQSTYVTCQYCTQGVSAKMFNRHVFDEHQDIMNCLCDICSIGNVMPGQTSHKCSFCNQVFCQKPMVYIHCKLCHADLTNSKVFTCEACPQSFLTKRMKELHCHEHHRQKLPVQSSASSVTRGTSTSTNNDPSTHVIHIGQDEGKQYLPKLSEASLNAVIKELLVFEKNAENPYKCLLCGRSFTKAKYIKLHIRRAHVRDEDQPYRCKICGSGFVRLTEFRKHSRSHSDFRPYRCRYCDKAFKQQANLRDHYRVHTNSKEFKCRFCNTEFRQRGGLTSHVVFHDTLKPFKCMYCHKGFTTRGELSRHMHKYNKDTMDTVEKSYPCHICEETFPHYPMLLKHIDAHNPEKPFKCLTCNTKFANYVAMYFHKVKEEHFLPEEIQEGVKDLQKRGRKFRAKKNSIRSLGPERVYKTNNPACETIYISQQESFSEGDAVVKPVEVIIDNFDQEQVVRVQETEPEHEELLSIAKQLTELSGFAESEFYTTKKNVHQEEDEIIRNMLDADEDVLANLNKQSIVIKEPGTSRERVRRVEENIEQRGHGDDDYDYMPEIENDSSTAINAEGTKYVIEEDGHISLVSKSIPTNMEELVSLVSQNTSSDNNEQLMAYQSEDGSVIYVCLSDDQILKTEEVIAEGADDELDDVGSNSETAIQDSVKVGMNIETVESSSHLYEESGEKSLKESQVIVDSLPTESVQHVAETDTGTIIHLPETEQTVTNHLPHTELISNQMEQGDGNEQMDTADEIQMSNFVSSNQNIHVKNDQQIFVASHLENTSVEDVQNSEFSLADSNFESSVITIPPKEIVSNETLESQEDLIRRSQLAKHLTGNIETSRNETRIYTTEQGLQSIGNEETLVAHSMTENVNIPEYIVAIPSTASAEGYTETSIVTTQETVNESTNFEQATINRPSDGFVKVEDTLVEYQIDESRFIKEELLDADYAESKGKDQEVMFFSDNIYTYSQQEKKFICLHCGAKITSFKNLKTHIRRHAPSSARIHNCTHCPKRFVTKNELKRHLYTHTGERNYECKVCGKRFIQPGHLQEHMRLHTGDKPFKCSNCSAAFVTKTQLMLHWGRLHSDNEIPCDKCDKIFKTHVDLRRHKGLEHSGINLRSRVVKEEGGDHVCDICGQSFSKKATLKRHLEKHNLESIDESERVEERFECPQCDMSFKTKYYIKEHIKMAHNEEKNELCVHCGESFKTKTLLRRHKDNKHPEDGNEKWYCKICNKSLGSKYAYGYHMGAKH